MSLFLYKSLSKRPKRDIPLSVSDLNYTFAILPG